MNRITTGKPVYRIDLPEPLAQLIFTYKLVLHFLQSSIVDGEQDHTVCFRDLERAFDKLQNYVEKLEQRVRAEP